MSEESRGRILSACATVIATSGIAGFRLSDVAREAGVSIGLLAYHFGGRDELLEAALNEVTAGAARRAEAQPGTDTAAARLTALLCSEFGEDPQTRSGSILWNELRAAAVFDRKRAAALRRATSVWQDAVAELLAAAAAEVTTAPETTAPETTSALILTTVVEGLSGRWLSGQITVDQARSTIQETLAAILRSPHTSPRNPRLGHNPTQRLRRRPSNR